MNLIKVFNFGEYNDLILPHIEVVKHQSLLKRYLLSLPNFRKPKFSFNWLFSFVLPWKTNGSIFRRLMPVSALAITGSMVVFGIYFYNIYGHNSQVQAQNVIHAVANRITLLSSEEERQIEDQINADLGTSVLEAHEAKDLNLVPEDQIIRIDSPTDNQVNSYALAGDNQQKLAVLKGINLLSYTNRQGSKIILGIDNNNIPQFKLAKFEVWQPVQEQ